MGVRGAANDLVYGKTNRLYVQICVYITTKGTFLRGWLLRNRIALNLSGLLLDGHTPARKFPHAEKTK